MQQLSEPQQTNEQLLIARLFDSAKQDLSKIEISKKERIQQLALELDNYGCCPTDMICDFIATKLCKFPDIGISRGFIVQALDTKYKDPARVIGGLKSKGKYKDKSQLQSEPLPQLYIPKVADYENFDIRDCNLDSWDYYPDGLKKRWVVQLIEDKKSLQCQIIELTR